MKPMLGSYSITFQLTTSRRGRRNRNHCDHDQGNFNSRPHEEVDTVSIGLVAVLLIFQLTTSRRGRQLLQIEQTVFMAFQLTTSRRGRLVLPLDNRSTHQYFNSRPHEEVDEVTLLDISPLTISTHDLTKRST